MSLSRVFNRLGLLVLLLPVLVAGQTNEAVAEHGHVAGGVNDGPYVQWRSPNEAVVQWVCDGVAKSEVHQVNSRLSIPAVCSDPRLQVVIDAKAPEAAPAVFDGIKKVIAIGDIHGEYEAACDLLMGAGVINSDLDWIWGDGHLVFCGDVFDRGDRVTECLWLIRKLERQAAQHGGGVHFILGNHEVMILQGDLRYLHDDYAKVVTQRLSTPYNELFGPDTELGRWLRTKPAMVRINDLLFVHGGISLSLAELDLSPAKINDLIRRNIDTPSDVLRSDKRLALLFGRSGPLWYRGYYLDAKKYEPADTETIQKIAEQFHVRTVVTGHTEVEHIVEHHAGAVIGIDIPLDNKSDGETLLYENGQLFRLSRTGIRHKLR